MENKPHGTCWLREKERKPGHAGPTGATAIWYTRNMIGLYSHIKSVEQGQCLVYNSTENQ